MVGCDGPTCSPPGAAPGLAYTLTALAFLAHSLDEMIRLPAWAGARGIPIQTAGFANAVLGLTIMGMVLFLLGRSMQFHRPVQVVIAVATGALLANVASHLAASLATMSVVPGLITAVVLILPSASWLLARLPLDRALKWRAGAAGAALMPVVAGIALWLAGGFS